MPSTNEEILITMNGKDNASQMFANVDGNAKSMASSISQALSSINNGMINLGQVSDNVMQSLAGKSAMDSIFGTTSKAETNSVLVGMMTDTEEAAESLNKTVDDVTNNSLTSMQDLIPALNAFKAATGASDKEIENITGGMADFGAAVLAQTGSTDLAAGAMMDLSKGVKGAFASLDQYGISEDALLRTGKWSGAENDVEGYMKAVQEVIGDTSKLMETNQGLDALIGKAFSRGGKRIGNEFLPQIKAVKKGFLELDDALGGNLTTSIVAFSGAMEIGNQAFWNISTTVNGIRDLKDAFSTLKGAIKGAGDAAEATGDVINAISNASDIGAGVAAAGPEMEAAAAGGVAVEAGASGLAATFSSLMVPLLAVSAAIIIMIPIVSFIAVEAMIFIKLLADFMKALNFDSINLDGAVRGLKSLTTAFLWIGAAMLTLTAVNLTTAIAVLTSNIFGMTGPLKVAIDALTDAAKLLQQFGSVQVNPGIAKNLKTISNSLMSVSKAMLALTATNITVGFSNFIGWALGFGSVTDGLEQAKNDIMQASTKLNEFSGLTPIPDNVASNIQNVCDSLASVGDAIGALREMRDGQNWDNTIGGLINGLFGDGLNIQQALNAVKTDIQKASQSLSEWTGLKEIPDGLSEKIKKVSDALTGINEAFQTLRSLQGDNNFDDMMGGLANFIGMGGEDLQTALTNVIKDINMAAKALSKLKIDDEKVNEDSIKKIQNVTTSLTEISNTVNSLTAIPPMEGFDSSIVTTAVTNVQKAANALNKLKIGEVNEDMITKIKNIAGAVTQISSVMNQLTMLPPMDGFDSSIISTAVTNVQTAATELSKLNETAFNAEGANSVLTSVQTAIENLKTTLSGATGFSEISAGIGSQIVSGVATGLAPLSGTVTSNVDTAIISAGGVALSGGTSLGNSVNNGFKSKLDLHTVMTTEMGYVKTAIDTGISEAKTAAQNGAVEVVEAFKNGINVGSPGDIARTMKQEMIYTKEAIQKSYSQLKSASYFAARSIVDSFGEPVLTTDFDNLFTPNQIGALETTVTRAPDKSDNRPVTIIVSEGAVNVDARNHTVKEAQSLMITAFEGMDNITNIDVNGA